MAFVGSLFYMLLFGIYYKIFMSKTAAQHLNTITVVLDCQLYNDNVESRMTVTEVENGTLVMPV